VRELLLLGDEVTTKICVAKGLEAGEKVREGPCEGGECERGNGLNGNVSVEELTPCRVLPVAEWKIEVRRMMGCQIIYHVEYPIKSSSPHVLRRAVMASEEMGIP
jgi:hypothetical protein